MNGRCEIDPLDPAVNVCDRCFGEFCATHLVQPKGRRHPYCNDCALEASGVRGSTTLILRGSRRTAKRRREELRESTNNAEQVFQFFEFDVTEEEPPEETSRRTLRRGKKGDETTGADDQGNTEADDDAILDDGVTVHDRLPPEAPPVTPAVAKLEKLRREAALSPGDESPAPGSSADPATPTPAATREECEPPSGPIASPSPATPSEPASSPSDRTEADDSHTPSRLPSRQSTVPTPLRRATDHPGSTAPTLDEPPAPPPAGRPATAPMIGEVRNVAGRRAADREPPAILADDDHAVAAAVGSLNAIDEFDAARPAAPTEPATTSAPAVANAPVGEIPVVEALAAEAPVADAPLAEAPAVDEPVKPEPPAQPAIASGDTSAGDEHERADVDANGNWIPPILRGMAPDAHEAGAMLPKRRNPDD